MQLINPTLFWVIYRGQEANRSAGALTPPRGGCSYLTLYGIIQPPAEDVIDDIGN